MPELNWIATIAQRVVLWLQPAGGQTVARRNARVSLAADTRRTTERLEVERVVEATLAARRGHAAAV
ncbi:MAG TPA: hypothetical protein VLR26_14040 [Frankiaceae bacterium]|nr:hypothetical protein [Frankiaceae bacterium]